MTAALVRVVSRLNLILCAFFFASVFAKNPRSQNLEKLLVHVELPPIVMTGVSMRDLPAQFVRRGEVVLVVVLECANATRIPFRKSLSWSHIEAGGFQTLEKRRKVGTVPRLEDCVGQPVQATITTNITHTNFIHFTDLQTINAENNVANVIRPEAGGPGDQQGNSGRTK